MPTKMTISQITNQISQICNRISTLSADIEDMRAESNDISVLFSDQRAGQLADLQELVLILTCLISPDEATDTVKTDNGSVFAEGDLTCNIGDKTQK